MIKPVLIGLTGQQTPNKVKKWISNLAKKEKLVQQIAAVECYEPSVLRWMLEI